MKICNECKKEFKPYKVLILQGKECPVDKDIGERTCQECMQKGWTDDPKEILEAFEKDPAFKIGIKSPYQHKKY